jgi:hypothetical protein
MLDNVLKMKPAEIIAEIQEFKKTSYDFMLWMKRHVEGIESRLDTIETRIKENESSRV